MKNFSFAEYNNIIDRIKTHLPIINFSDVNSETKRYCVIRHDVEFSIDRALDLAIFENSIDLKTTYCIQVNNNNYNPFSNKNLASIKRIIELGHDISLHAHLGCYETHKISVEDYILRQAVILSTMLEYPINKFSIHRPIKKYIEDVIVVPGLMNLSDELFFSYTENFTLYDLPVLYLADSNHQWKYGNPLEVDFSKINKFQLNCHPFSWTNSGFNNYDNFEKLLFEKQNEALFSIDEEIRTFPKEMFNLYTR